MEISGDKFKGRVNYGLLDMLILWIRDFCALRGCPEDMSHVIGSGLWGWHYMEFGSAFEV